MVRPSQLRSDWQALDCRREKAGDSVWWWSSELADMAEQVDWRRDRRREVNMMLVLSLPAFVSSL